MAEIHLDIEWGEQPFAFGEDGWPGPLIRPYPYLPDTDRRIFGEPIPAPDGLLERYQAAEREFLAVQAELRTIAKEHGDIGE